MRDQFYRDAHVGLCARLSELEARIRAREAELTPAFWMSLDPYVRERLEHSRAALALVRSDSLSLLTEAEARLSAYADELDAWVGRAPQLAERWGEVPEDVDEPAAPRMSGFPLASGDWSDFARQFHAAVREAAPEATIVRTSARALMARFRSRGAPFVLRAMAFAGWTGHLRDSGMQLVTSVARAAPKLVVKHESLLVAVRKSMSLWRDVEIGDASFDGLFAIDGEESDAQRLLIPKVRAALLALARFDVPTLRVDPTHCAASLSWSFEPAAGAITAAIRALIGIREIPVAVTFRRPAAYG